MSRLQEPDERAAGRATTPADPRSCWLRSTCFENLKGKSLVYAAFPHWAAFSKAELPEMLVKKK
jgi:hypothetical protein